MTNTLLSLLGIALGVPSAMVAFQDWQQRRIHHHRIDLPAAPIRQPVGAKVSVSAGLPIAPPAAAISPTVRPANALHFRTTIDMAEPLSFPRRVLAGLVDFYGVYLLAALITGAAVDPAASEDSFATALGLLVVAGFTLVARMNAGGGSPGKRLVGGRLVRNSSHSQPVTFWRSLGRMTLALVVPFSSWFVLGKSRRAAHDRMTDTKVVRVR